MVVTMTSVINYKINLGNAEKDDTNGKESDHSSATVGYIVSSDEANDDFESSDDEPLSKYVKKRLDSPKFDKKSTNTTPTIRARGRPCSKASAKPPESVSRVNAVQRHVQRDRVDEECVRLGIVYKRWEPLNPDQESHPSVRDIQDGTIIPSEQNIPEWCILCLQNKYLKDESFVYTHYLRVHHKKLIVVNN